MGMIASLFLIGLAGLSLPLIFHLVRRTPRGRQEFSSLMFLAPTPPRLTRRSRLDQVLLLLLRLAALALLVFAFARPFLRESSLLSINDLPRRRVALLVDTSASMNRADLWQQALAAIEHEVSDLAPHDEVALYTFSDRLTTVVGFPTEEKKTNTLPATEVVRSAVKSLKPGWASGDLGSALATLAAELDASNDVQQAVSEPRLIVISDFQKSTSIKALEGFAWPEKVRVVTKLIKPKLTTNAAAQLLAASQAAPDEELRVRVTNAADSAKDQFFVRWQNPKKPTATDGEVAVYVPPGQSRVVKLPRSTSNLLSDRVVLRGDDHDFDNAYYVVPPKQQQLSVAYFGDDKEDDPQAWQYYLRLATEGDPLREVKFTVLAEKESSLKDLTPQLVVVTRPLSGAQVSEVQKYVEQGGKLLFVASDAETGKQLVLFYDDVELAEEKAKRSPDEFHLLGTINFQHPFFAPFDNPRYNDFTGIHFWVHQGVKLKTPATTTVVASFDNNDPYLLERSHGKGKMWALTSGWRPDDSQLAVSSKFLPLVGSLLDQASGLPPTVASTDVNSPVALPRTRPDHWIVADPIGTQFPIDEKAAEFRDTAQPGIYHGGSGKDEFRFAVNIPASESETAALPVEDLEQLGVKLIGATTKTERFDRMRQRRDTELESRQQFWRYLMVGCMAVLIVETWWAGRASRATQVTREVVA